MKLYSWNMLYTNPDPARAFSFIKGLDFDVLCLQEASAEFLSRLRTLGLFMAEGKELDFVYGTESRYCVILSNYPIVAQKDFALPEHVQPLRAKAFMLFMHLFGWRFVTNRRSIFADIETPCFGRVRVFCLHCTLSHPQQRAREFEAVMALCDDTLPTFVCGDLNILERARVTLLNWLSGGRIRDIVAWRSERRDTERMFARSGLQNPLRGKPTQTISHSQLDHILVPARVHITKAEVLPDRVGSDHNPIMVDCRR